MSDTTSPSDPHDSDPAAGDLDSLFDELYRELRKKAHECLRRNPSATLQTTALLNETYIRMSGGRGDQWDGHQHFLGYAAKAMRAALVDYERKRHALKRGAGERPLPLDNFEVMVPSSDGSGDMSVSRLDEALQLLAKKHPDLARIAEQKWFAGLSIRDTAKVLGVSENKVRLATAYLRDCLGDENG